MRKLFIAFTIVLLIFPTMAFAQEGKAAELRAAVNAKLSPSLEAPHAKSADPQAAAIDYNYGAIYNYQATDNQWWSGLVIRNSTEPNDMQVKLFDSGGSLRGEGTFHIDGFNTQRIGLLKDFISTGYVPLQGSVYVYGTEFFSTYMIVGNNQGGFGMIEESVLSY